MKKILLTIAIVSLFAVGCNKVPAENANVNAPSQTIRVPVPQSKMEIKAANSSYAVNEKQIENVEVVDSQMGAVLQIKLNEEGSKILAKITTENIGKEVPISIDGKVISSPTVQNPITTGDFVLSNGTWTKSEAQTIKENLLGYKEEVK